MDTIALDSSSGDGHGDVPFPSITFGCRVQNTGTFGGGESGVVGLGGGNVSLVRQLDQGKFSDCLVSPSDESNSSKLNFGDDARVEGPRVVTTPMVKKNPDTYYFTLRGISNM